VKVGLVESVESLSSTSPAYSVAATRVLTLRVSLSVFLKFDNAMGGRYLAEITREVFTDLEVSKYTLAEYRVSITGQSRDEWAKLARWVVGNNLASPQVRWLVQIPRLYELYKANGRIHTFQEMLDNIFQPLFDVTLDPSCDPTLHRFLTLVVALDSVDDESHYEMRRDGELPLPEAWDLPDQPPYHYWTFFLAENVKSLNLLRETRRFSLFSYRPHAGEAGDPDHLAAAFLTAESINHGINLEVTPALQYLYYLAQVRVFVCAVSLGWRLSLCSMNHRACFDACR
jgi:AMP deaminase